VGVAAAAGGADCSGADEDEQAVNPDSNVSAAKAVVRCFLVTSPL
jgi:hypothetical protein